MILLCCCLRRVWLVYNGIVWAICICGIGVIVSFVVPFVASEYAMSFPFILVWALTFWIVMLSPNHFMCCIIESCYWEFIRMVVLGGWASYMIVNGIYIVEAI